MMVKLKNHMKKLIYSNTFMYLSLFVLIASSIMDTVTIVVCILNYAITNKGEYLSNITTYALIVSFTFILIVYIINKLKYKMYQSLVQMEKEKWERL